MAPVTVAVDIYGGDYGPEAIIKGVLEAFAISKTPFAVSLCGERDEINNILQEFSKEYDIEQYSIDVIHCPHIDISGESPSRVWKRYNNSSIVKTIQLQCERKVQVSLSTGDTGVLISTSAILLGKHAGISRPALGILLPTVAGGKTLLLDVGANLDCRTEHLVSFGVAGANYYRTVCDKEVPSVGVLNIGHEENKGTKRVKKCAQALKTLCKGFAGFVEGNQILAGGTDVIVCDGFVGNVMLKSWEGFYRLAKMVLREQESSNVSSFKKTMGMFNANKYGAAPLIGVDGLVFKAHGASSYKAVMYALLTAVDAAYHTYKDT